MNKTVNSNLILYKMIIIFWHQVTNLFFILLLKFSYTLDFEQTILMFGHGKKHDVNHSLKKLNIL